MEKLKRNFNTDNQRQHFMDTARELGRDEDEAAFENKLRYEAEAEGWYQGRRRQSPGVTSGAS